MKQNNIKSKHGFTIIEVVLVLAIAGLIFLMVFVALPALQRNQKDTQRRQDYANLSANITNYMTNNGGRLPKAGVDLAENQYINSTGQDPDGVAYTITVAEAKDTNTESATPTLTAGQVYVFTGANCSGSNDAGNAVPKVDTRSKAFAIYGYLETGTYCQSSM